MRETRAIGIVAISIALAACGPTVPARLVSWRGATAVVTPQTAAPAATGRLVVETDTDQKQIGDSTYYNVRRPYYVYSTDGRLVERVDNQGARSGEEPEVVSLPAGRYVVASVVGNVLRRVQVEVRPGALTRVGEALLGGAPRVFAVGSR